LDVLYHYHFGITPVYVSNCFLRGSVHLNEKRRGDQNFIQLSIGCFILPKKEKVPLKNVFDVFWLAGVVPGFVIRSFGFSFQLELGGIPKVVLV
jgi:hypothetical protein